MPMSNHHQTLALPAHPSDGTELTLSVLGCGTMGIAILSGILSSLSELNGPKPLQTLNHHGTSDPLDDPVPDRLPSRFIACVRCPESAKRVKKALWEHSSFVKVAQNDNVAAVKQSEVVILACKPSMISSMLSEPGLAKALRGKLLISIAAGVKVEQIEAILKEADNSPVTDNEDESRCRVVRAIPNTAAKISESMTVVALPDNPPLSPQAASLVTWVFRRIGDVVYLPPNNMDASTALAGAGPAFFALILESAIDGAVAMGLPRREATRMAAQAMRGTATMVQSGEHPAILREKNTTPGGCTIGGLLVLEEGGVRGTVSRAVREATVVASQLGKGTENVNGTRFYADNGGF